MRLSRRHPLLVPVLLCAFAVLVARPTGADEEAGDGPGGRGSGTGSEVARLYQDAILVTQQYEAGLREADEQEARLRRAGQLLDRERRELAVLHEDLGRDSRARYGGPDQSAQLRRALPQANPAVGIAIGRSRRTEARLAADKAAAAARWQTVARRNRELADVKRTIEAKLDEARRRLQGRADVSVARGSCGSAVRLDRPRTSSTRAWVAPVETYRLSASFGSGGERWAHRHTGQDFAVPIGTPVRAAGAGRVVKVSCGGAFGIQVVVRHENGYYTQYAHLAAVSVAQDDRVAAGQWIGQSGTTGNSTGPHLHFEVRVTPQTGSALDPVPWLGDHGVAVG
ncbi:M23 family metallopeptidase [Streptomyces sp. NPDC059582]|uniref:M23 family metallopeptidase n=1 Tax=Streptomyces sp. NPDC059582 TaxID=3346875 RepID=UPI0036A86E83